MVKKYIKNGKIYSLVKMLLKCHNDFIKYI